MSPADIISLASLVIGALTLVVMVLDVFGLRERVKDHQKVGVVAVMCIVWGLGYFLVSNLRPSVQGMPFPPTPTPTPTPRIDGPSFDCRKAHNNVEHAICQDSTLAQDEREMASVYWSTFYSLHGEQQKQFRREHAQWFTQYMRVCNSQTSSKELKTCIADYLTRHTRNLLR